MRHLRLVLFLIVFAIPQGQSWSQDENPGTAVHSAAFGDLFRPQRRPLSDRPIPASATFFTIDPVVFDQLALSHHPTIVVDKVHLNNRQTGTLVLRRFDVLRPGAPVVVGTPDGDRPVDLPIGRFFTGSVREIPGSFVYLAVFPTYCSGYIEVPSGTNGLRRYTIAPLALADGAPSIMVIYDEMEALLRNHMLEESHHWECGAENIPDYYEAAQKALAGRGGAKEKSRRLQSNAMLVAQIAIDCDSAFYVAHGRNLSRALDYALTVMGASSAIYQRDVNVTLQVPYLRIWTGADPYPGTTSTVLLSQFKSYWSSNMSGVDRSLAQLLSTSSIGGGVAYISALCSQSSGYAVLGLNNNATYPTTAYVWDTDVTSHETGHNFGSPHTHSCLWSPAIDSCYTSEGGCFSGTTPRVGTIMSYCHLTQFGTQLYMHPRVAELVRSRAEMATCVGLLQNSAANDVGVTHIVMPAPGGRIAKNASFTPSAIFVNAGTSPQSSLPVTFTIRDSAGSAVYTGSTTIASLAPGASATVNFSPTSISTLARYGASVSITLSGDSYPHNNTMVRQFEVVSSTSGSFTLTAPNAATTFRAGEPTTITWSYSGSITSARIDFSPDDGATWRTVGTNISPSAGSYSWIVPAVATQNGRIRISDRDNSMTRDENDAAFTIEVLPLDWQWARTLGGLKNEDVRGVATDAQGNVYVAGGFTDSMVAGGTKVFAVGGMDVFLARYNAGGTLQWLRSFGGSGNDTAMGVAVGGNGDVVLTGGFYGSMVVGSQTLTSAGDEDVFVVKYGSDGNVKWSQGGGGIGRDEGRGIAVDGSGNAAVTGLFSGSGSFGGVTLASQGQTDMFVVKYGGDGNVQWGERGGGNDVDEGNGVAVDGSGNVVVVGRYRGNASFGGDAMASAGGDDGFMAKYNSSGAAQWGATLGGSSNDDARAVQVDGGGNVVVTGTVSGLVNFGTIFASSVGGRDVYVAKYNAIGTVQWVRTGGSSGDDYATAMAMDGDGNSYIAGHFQGTFNIAGLTLASAGESDAMVLKVAPDGLLNWARRGGGIRAEEAHAIAVNAAGNSSYVGGSYFYTTPSDQPSIFGSDSLQGAGMMDGFVNRVGMFRITSPKTNDAWGAGSSRTITWTSFGASQVKIEYSTNNGANWITAGSSIANTGSYAWTLPNVSTTTALVRVSDADNPAVRGEAISGTFSIGGLVPPSNLIATPHDGSVDLAWTGSPSGGLTAYAIYRGATPGNMTRIATIDTSARTYHDASVVNCTDYVYGVTAVAGVLESAMSNTAGARPAANGTIEVTAPVADERLSAGTSRTITWTSSGCLATVQISYSTNGGSSWNSIVAETPNDGSHSWTVPGISAAQVIIRIADAQNTAVFGLSGVFSICNLPATIPVTGATTFCEGTSTTLSAPGGYAGYLWSNGATTRDLAVTEPGSYTVTVTDAGGCTGTSNPVNVVRYARPQPAISASGPLVFCQGENVTLTAPAGYAGYVWSNGSTAQQITVTQSGSFTVTVTDGNGCSGTSGTTMVTVYPTPNPVITAGGPTTFCEGGSVTLSAPAGYSGYRWSNGATTQQIAVMAGGTFTVTVTSSNGCSGTSPATTVVVHPRPTPVITAGGPTEFCEGGSVVLSAPSGYAGYVWSNGATTREISATQGGNYTVTVTDGNGCTGTSPAVAVTVHPRPIPVITPSGATEFCEGGSVVLSAPAGYAGYAWSNGSTAQQITVSQSGSYTVSVTDVNGCSGASAATSVVVHTNPHPVITASGATEFCEGGSVTLSAPAGFAAYRWSSGAITQQITVLATETLTVTVTDANGCSGTSPAVAVVVHPRPHPVITANGPTEFCAGGTVLLSAPFGYASYLWSNGARTRDVIVSSSGSYTVSVTDANGCTGTSPGVAVTVYERPNPIVTPGGPTSFCEGGSVTLSAPEGYISYAWSNGEWSRTITATTSGTYYVVVTDANGCVGTSAGTAVTVFPLPEPLITANGPTTFCEGGSVVLSAPSGYADYAWTNGATTREITVSESGSYRVTVTDVNGCTGISPTTTVTVRANPAPVITAGGPTEFCEGGSVVLSAPSGYAGYQWTNGATTREIIVTATGNYSVTVTDLNGCAGTSPATAVTVHENPTPVITANGPTEFCEGGSVVLSAPAGYASYAWTNGAMTREITVSASGTFTVTVSDGDGCAGTSPVMAVTVHENPEPVITAGGPTEFCEGGSVVLSAPAGHASYAWTNGATTREITVVASGDYAVTVGDANGCTGTSPAVGVTVHATPMPVILASGPTEFCEGGSVVLSAPSGYVSYAWSNGAATREITVTESGSFTVTVGDANGCTGTSPTAAVMVHENPEPVIAADGPTEFCAGGSVVLSAPSGYVSYAWTNGAATREITVVSSGEYSVTVHDANGCTGTSPATAVTVHENPAPVITANGPTEFCEGGSVVLSAPEGYASYAWSNGAATRQIIATQSGDYTVTVGDANGCTGTSPATTVTVYPNPAPVITAGGPTEFCEGGSVVLSAPSGYASYQWSNGATTREITVSTTGTFTVTVDDEHGCTGTSPATAVMVYENPEPVIAAGGPTEFCEGGSVVLSAPAGFDSYAWSNGAATREITVIASGDYSVTVGDANGCSGTSPALSVTVYPNPVPTITADGPTEFCEGGSVVLSAPSGYVSYAWTNGATTREITVIASGDYSVTVGDANGCSGTSPAMAVTVHENPAPVITANGPTEFCEGGSVVLSAPAGYASYAWTNGATTREITVVTSGEYSVTVHDANGCMGASPAMTVTVYPNPVPVITAGGPTEFCEGGSVVLSAPSGYVSYQWTNGATTREITVVSSGDYAVTVGDASGCTGASPATTVTVHENPAPVIVADGPMEFCEGGSVVLSAPSGYASYQWSNGATTREITVGESGSFTVTVSDANGCTGTSPAATVTVYEIPAPVITANGPTEFCEGGSVVLSAPEGYASYLWSNGSLTREITAIEGGEYTVMVDDGHGCMGTSPALSVTVHPNPLPVITASGSTEFCAGGSVVLSAPAGHTTYAWTNGATTREITVIASGDYSVTVGDANGCTGTSPAMTVTVHEPPVPVITANGPTEFCEGGSVVLSAPAGYVSYAWTSGATTREITVIASGEYSVTVTDANGCTGTSSATAVTVHENPAPVITANGATEFCEGGSVVLSAPAGYAGYRWTNGATTREIVVAESGSFSVTVSSGEGCTGTSSAATVTVYEIPAPVIAASGPTEFCKGGSVTLSAPIGFDSYAWTNGATTREITVAESGSFSVTVGDANGCMGTSPVVAVMVHENPRPAITADGPTEFCEGGSVVLSAPVGYVSYAWTNGATTREITVVSSGDYAVTVGDANGCTGTSPATTVTVHENPVPVITANGATEFCEGGSVVLSAPAGYASYRWSNGIIAREIMVNTTGEYTVTVANEHGCMAVSPAMPVTVHEIPRPEITANGPTEFCEGGSVVLSAPAGYASYRWTNGATTREIVVIESGSFSVTVGDEFGCSGTSPAVAVTVRKNPHPVIAADGPTEFCEGGSVTLSAPAGYISYQWSNGATTRQITVAQSGSYNVTVTDGNGCPGTSQVMVVTVNPRPYPVISASGPTVICEGESVVLSVPAGYISYQWSNGATTPSITVTRTGSYTVTVTDVNGCSGISWPVDVKIMPRPHPVIAANGPTEFCEGGSVVLSAPEGYAGYLWSNGARTRQITVLEQGAYTVAVTDVTGCSGTSSPVDVIITPRPVPVITANGPTEFCEGGSVVLSAPEGYVGYLWSNGATTREITTATSGVFAVTVTDAKGCSGTSAPVPVTSNVLPHPVITADGPIRFCEGGSVMLSAPAGYISYRWSNGATTRQIRVTESGHYTVTVTNAEGCSGTSPAMTVAADVRPHPTIAAGGPTEFCEGGNVMLSAPEGYISYLWSNGATTRQIMVTQSGAYTVTVTDAGGCTGTSEGTAVNVEPNPVPVISALGPTSFCQGDSVVLSAPEGYAGYRWSNGATTRQIVTHTGGDYRVTVTNAHGCTGASPVMKVTVYPNPRPVISAGGPTNFCEGGSVTLSAPEGYAAYQWSNGATTRQITVTKKGIFSVTVQNASGCIGTSDAVEVTVAPIPAPKIVVDGPTMLCQDGSVILNAPDGYAGYRWSNGATTRRIVVTEPGDYSVTVTSANGCMGVSETVSVRYNPKPRPTITANDVTSFCEGDSVVLSAPDGYAGYLWSNGATTREIVVVASGNYMVTVTDSNGCSGTSPKLLVTVQPRPHPIVTASGPISFCEGESVTLSAPDGYAGYLWSNGAMTREIVVTGEGNYSVMVTNATGCAGQSVPVPVKVFEKPRPAITKSGPTIFHTGDKVVLTAPIGYSYQWSSGERSRSITVMKSGWYAVTVTNANGCSGTSDSVIVTVLPRSKPFIIVEGSPDLCPGDAVWLTAPDHCTSYQWSTGETTRSIMVVKPGSYTVTTVNDEGEQGVSDPQSISMRQGPPKPVIMRKNGGAVLYCTVEADAYRWFRNGEVVEEGTERSLAVYQDGEYVVQVTGASGCTNISDPALVRFSTSAVTGMGSGASVEIAVQPNPASDFFTVELHHAVDGGVRLQLSDMSGREVLRINDIQAGGHYRRDIDITKLSSGAYMLEISTDGGIWRYKVVKRQ